MKTHKKLVSLAAAVSICASVMPPIAASANLMVSSIDLVDEDTAVVSAASEGFAVIASYDGGRLTSVKTTPVAARSKTNFSVKTGDKVMLWNDLKGENKGEPLTDAVVVKAVEETPSPTPTQATDDVIMSWKFDFGKADDVAEGYTAVTPDKNYVKDQDYGFLGIDETGSLLGPRLDGFNQQDGQIIELKAGGGTGLNDAIGSVGEDTSGNAGDKYYPVRFAMKADDETYYRIKATVTTLDSEKDAVASLYTERKHPLYTEKEIKAGETVTTEFTIRVTPIYYQKSDPTGSIADGMVNVAVLGENSALAALEIDQLKTAPTLWVLGDSTVTDGGGTLPFFPLQNYTGVGTGLTKYLPSNIAMVNEGEGGLSATDSYHFNMVKSRIIAGDYMYVEYGHNHKNSTGQTYTSEYWRNNYVSSLKKYYEACRDAQGGEATLIIVGPIDRHNTSQYDEVNNVWSSTLDGFSNLGKQYVDALRYGGEETAKSFLDKWQEIADYAESKKTGSAVSDAAAVAELNTMKAAADKIVEDAVSGADVKVENVAFVDLNHPSLEWLATISKSAVVKGETRTNDPELTDYYFQIPKGGKVDGTHPNDAGAQCLAYYFFTTADDTAYPALTPLLANFKDGAVHEEPTPVSPEIINMGKAGQTDAWPAYQAPVQFEYPIVIKDIKIDEDGKFINLTANVQASFSNYALGVVKIYDEDGKENRQIVTTEHIDNTNGTGEKVLAFDSVNPPVLAEGETYKAYMWSCDMTTERLMTEEEGGEYLSSIYTPTNIDTYLLPGEKGKVETFEYTLKTNLTDADKYGYVGRSVATTTLGTDENGVTYSTIGSDGNNSYWLGRALENLEGGTGRTGKYMIDCDMKYVSGGGLVIGFLRGYSTKKTSDIVGEVPAFEVAKDGNVIIASAKKGDSAIVEGGESSGQISGSSWTNVHYILDMNTGKASLSVAGGTPVEIDMPAYQTFGESETAESSLNYFIFDGLKGNAFNVLISNLTVAKLKEDEKATISVKANEDARGSVYIGEAGTTSVTVTAGEHVTLTAAEKEGSVFSNWTDEEGNVISTDTEINVKAYRTAEITANFVQELDKTSVASYDIVADKLLVKTGGTVNLSLENVKSENGTPIKSVVNTDVTWSSDEPGVTVSEDGVATLSATSMASNTVKSVTLKGVLNGVEKTCAVEVYTYAFYEDVNGGQSGAAWDGDIGVVANKNCIGMPGGGNASTLTIDDAISIEGKATTISYIAAGGGSDDKLCGQPRHIEFYDSEGNKVINEIIGYSWQKLAVGGSITDKKDNIENGTDFANAVALGSWSTPVTITINADGATGTVEFGGASANITVNSAAKDIKTIKLIAASGAPGFASRALGLTEISIAQ